MRKPTHFVSFSGKGGSGKTTTASLFLATLLKQAVVKEILVIDADPDANLADTLGVEVRQTLGQILDQRKKELDEPGSGGTKLRFLIWDAICQGPGFDFLVMGRSIGSGCYCSVNSFLNTVLEETVSKYDLVLIDFDAGLEHFSRRAGHPADTLVVTCDPSKLSFDTAGRIRELITELALPYENQYLVGCCFSPEQQPLFNEMAALTGLEALGVVPFSSEIASKNLAGEPLLSFPADDPVIRNIEEIMAPVIAQFLK